MAAANAWNQMPEAPDVSDAEIEEEGEYFADGEATTTANSNIPIWKQNEEVWNAEKSLVKVKLCQLQIITDKFSHFQSQM